MKTGSVRMRRMAAVAVVAIAVVAAACSSSSTSSSASGGGSSSTSASPSTANAIPEAASLVKALEARPEHLPSSEPVGKPIPSGKTIDWLQCSTPACTILTKPLEDAAATLGWKVRVIDAGITPATVKAAWDVAVSDHPDAVMATGFPKSIFASELAQLKAENIPVIDGFVADTSGTGITAVVQGNNTNQKIGVALADWVLSQKGKKANALLVSSSTFTTLARVQSGFKTEYQRLCSTCGLSTLNEPATTFGTSLPGDIVAYLRTHPSINYVVADEGSMPIGLPQALATAGIKVTVVTQFPSQTTVQYLQEGKIQAIVMPQEIDAMWQMTDALARYFAGVSVVPSEAASPLWAVTPGTASQLVSPYYLVPKYQTKYEQLWGVKKS